MKQLVQVSRSWAIGKEEERDLSTDFQIKHSSYSCLFSELTVGRKHQPSTEPEAPERIWLWLLPSASHSEWRCTEQQDLIRIINLFQKKKAI